MPKLLRPLFTRDFWNVLLPALAILIAAFWIAFQFVQPAPKPQAPATVQFVQPAPKPVASLPVV
jgi:hypothetical protein